MRSFVAVAALVAVAAGLRLYGLGSQLWYDEIATLVESVRLPIARIVTEFPGVNTHPLYSVFAHLSLASLGESSWALRLPAALFGIASVPAVVALGVRLTGRAEAMAGALLLAVSYHHIWFSQNARGYTLMGLLALASTLFLLRAAETGRRGDYALYALACAAGVYTHLTMAFVVVAHAMVMIGGHAFGWRPAQSHPLRPLVWAWAGVAVLAGAAYAPFIPGLLEHFGTKAPVQAARVATGSWAIAEVLRSVLSGAGTPAAIAGACVALLGVVSLWRRQPLGTALLIAPAIVTAAAIVLLGQPMRPRFFFFLSGSAAVFAGRGLGVLAGALVTRRMTSPAPLVAVLGVLIAAASAIPLPRNYRVPKQDFVGAIAFLEGEEASGARVLAAGPICWPLEQHFGKSSWPCLTVLGDFDAIGSVPGRALIVHTLIDYADDPELGSAVRTRCFERRRFAGTLGGGDVVVCEPRAGAAR